MFEIEQLASQGAKIKVVGVGGSGCNAVNTMIRMGLQGVEFITANTDKQALEASLAGTKLPIGQELTKGLGAGANPEVGRKAALEDYARISETLAGADMVFITAGMGGGTGTGAAPVFAKIAREVGALTVGVVTKPFQFEGKKRMKHAQQGIAWLRENVDSLIMIPNQRLLAVAGSTLSMLDAFKKADEVLLNAVQGISDLINHTGLINSDFADVRTIMQAKGLALMGIGYGEGEHRAIEAATSAISSPLLEDVSIQGATGIIINVTGGSSLTIHEVNEATTLIMEAAHEDAEIIFGTVIDETMKDKVKVTVIATGLGGLQALASAGAQASASVSSVSAASATAQSHANFASDPTVSAGPITAMEQMKASFAALEMGTGAVAAEPPRTVVPPPMTNVAAMLAGNHAQASASASAQTADLAGSVMDSEQENLSEQAHLQGQSGDDELARARAIAQRLGITNLTDDQYEIPTYMRRQQSQQRDL